MSNSTDHKNIVREEFTKQAAAYAANTSLTDNGKIKRLISATDASSEARVLDVATGPGHLAFGFAEVCNEVVGIDLTEAPLAIAEETKQEYDADNIQFVKSDAETLPFDDNTFDIVICRLAFHHFENPAEILQQMVRVCRPNGTVGIADLVVSEYTERGNYQNQFEQLRDPSHVRALSPSDLITLFTDNELEISKMGTDILVQEVEQWLSNAQTPKSRADEARRMIKRDAREDLSGTRPFRQDDNLYFIQSTAIIVGRWLAKSDCNNKYQPQHSLRNIHVCE